MVESGEFCAFFFFFFFFLVIFFKINFFFVAQHHRGCDTARGGFRRRVAGPAPGNDFRTPDGTWLAALCARAPGTAADVAPSARPPTAADTALSTTAHAAAAAAAAAAPPPNPPADVWAHIADAVSRVVDVPVRPAGGRDVGALKKLKKLVQKLPFFFFFFFFFSPLTNF
jgi:hypothetical protein